MMTQTPADERAYTYVMEIIFLSAFAIALYIFIYTYMNIVVVAH